MADNADALNQMSQELKDSRKDAAKAPVAEKPGTAKAPVAPKASAPEK